MRTADQWISEYGESHQDPLNKMIHYLCVPAILFSIIGLLSSIPLGSIQALFPASIAPFIHLGTLLIILSLIFYIRLSFLLFLGMLMISVLTLWGNYQLAVSSSISLWIISLAIFATAWVLQFIGHNHEGKKPSFLKDVQFLLIGPAWILAHFYSKLGIKY